MTAYRVSNIITIHINAGGTGKVLDAVSVSPWKYVVGGVTILCYPAVNCYILITGFFSWKASFDNRKTFKKIALLWFSIVFFSVMGYFVISLIQGAGFDFWTLVKRFFPLIRGKWWFMVVYVALILISPFLNILIENISKKQFMQLLITGIVLFTIIPMINNWDDKFGVDYGYTLIWFIMLYLTGAYISKYELYKDRKISWIIYLFLYLFTSVLIYLLGSVLGKLGIDFYLNPYNSPFTYVRAIMLFMSFCTMNTYLSLSKIGVCVSKIAILSLASYLLHCQEDVEGYIWDAIHPSTYANDKRIVFVYLFIVFGVFITGIVLELLRRLMFSRFEEKIISGILSKK